MKITKTSKLFHGKYPYKIVTKVIGAYLIRRYGCDRLKQCIENNIPDEYLTSFFRFFNLVNKSDVVRFVDKAKKYIDQGIKIRFEWHTVHFYTDNKDEFDRLSEDLKPWIKKVYVVDNADLATINSKVNLILCNQYPHDAYEYRLWIRTKNISNKEKFLNWCNNYPNDIFMPQSTKLWLSGVRHYGYEYYFYIRDQKTLMLVQLFLGSGIKKVEQYVLRNTQINSVSEDKECQT